MKKKDKLIWQSQTLLKPTSCNCFLIWPGRLNKKKKKVERKEKKDKRKRKKKKIKKTRKKKMGKGEGKENRRMAKHFEKERNGGKQRNQGICLICSKLLHK